MKDFAKRLDMLRREGEAKKDFASRIQVSPVQLSRYYAGAIPGRKVLERIARNTGASVDWLLYGDRESRLSPSVRRLGAKTSRPLSDKDLLKLACSYLDELKNLRRSKREILKEILRQCVENPETIDKVYEYQRFLRYNKESREKKGLDN